MSKIFIFRSLSKVLVIIKLVKKAKPLLDKYPERLHTRYSSFENLDRAINEGMRSVKEKAKLMGITFYCARHTFANPG